MSYGLTQASLFLVLSLLPSVVLTHEVREPSSSLERRANASTALGFFNPLDNGGNFLTDVPDTFPAGQHEPINVVISADSDPRVLVYQQTDGGLLNFFNAVGYANECLGQHLGDHQAANLGDGNGFVNETAVIRWDYGNPAIGTCEETVNGGSHLRFWPQNGSQHDTRAIFMALSYEEPANQSHNIVFNGYTLGREWFIGNVTNQSSIIPSTTISNASTFTGERSFGNYTYKTSVQYMSGFLPNTSDGINHNATVVNPGMNAADGFIAVLNVSISSAPSNSSSGTSSSPSSSASSGKSSSAYRTADLRWLLASALVALSALAVSLA